MNMPYILYINKDQFKEFTGYDLERDDRLRTDDSGSRESTIKTFLTESASMVYQFVASRIFDATIIDVIMKEEQFKSYIEVAQLMQSKYMYENGNSTAINGLTNSGQPIELKEIRGDRAYSPEMIKYLETSGLLFGGY